MLLIFFLYNSGHVTLWFLEVVPVVYASNIVPLKNTIELVCTTSYSFKPFEKLSNSINALLGLSIFACVKIYLLGTIQKILLGVEVCWFTSNLGNPLQRIFLIFLFIFYYYSQWFGIQDKQSGRLQLAK